MSYENDEDCGLTELEMAAGVSSLINGRCGRHCPCEICCEKDWDEIDRRNFLSSDKFKAAAKLVAGLSDKKKIKNTLIHRAHRDKLDSAILRYMAKEDLPGYYAGIVKSPDCVAKLIEGILYKVCKINPESKLSEQIRTLSDSLQRNIKRRTAYDRVSDMQQFLHRNIDQILGVGAARSVPVAPMKNALSAARLNLHILDIINRQPDYIELIEILNSEAMKLEYQSPRPPTAPWGKLSQPRWRVRHLRPFSYYFPQESRALLNSLRDLDEDMPLEQFFYEASGIYARF